MEVESDGELLVTVARSKSYDLVIGKMEMSSQEVIGEVSVPVQLLLQRMEREDRDFDGMVYTTKPIDLDLLNHGQKVGKLTMAFESKTLPDLVKVDMEKA